MAIDAFMYYSPNQKSEPPSQFSPETDKPMERLNSESGKSESILRTVRGLMEGILKDRGRE